MTRNNLKELVEGLIKEVLGKFDLNAFKRIASAHEHPEYDPDEHGSDIWDAGDWGNRNYPEIQYARKFLPLLGKGSSRITFAYSGGKALKIALSEAGIEQNKEEVNIYTKNQGNEIVTKIFDFDPHYKWVIAEIVKPFRYESEFKELLGITFGLAYSLATYGIDSVLKEKQDSLSYWEVRLEKNQDKYASRGIELNIADYKRDIEEINKANNDPRIKKFIAGLNALHNNHGLATGDINLEHFGKTVDGQVKFYDYGASDELVSRLYRR